MQSNSVGGRGGNYYNIITFHITHDFPFLAFRLFDRYKYFSNFWLFLSRGKNTNFEEIFSLRHFEPSVRGTEFWAKPAPLSVSQCHCEIKFEKIIVKNS
jgi:hypothetical protein